MIRQPTSRTCFICGRENDFGLKMVWYNNLESNQVESVGWLEHKGNRGMKVAAKLLLSDGTITTECKAVVVRPTGEISKSWEHERKFWQVEDD